MDANLHTIIEKRINRTIGNLQNNKMDAYYVKTCAEAVKLCEELCPEGQTVSCGGSATLDQSGIKRFCALENISSSTGRQRGRTRRRSCTRLFRATPILPVRTP